MSADHQRSPAGETRTLRAWIVHALGIKISRKEQVYLSVSASAVLRDGAYWLEIFFSAGIATLGLILNSPAVIIGAMLISPLMGPILANGLAFAAGDLVLALRAMTNLLLSALLAVGFATFLVILLPFREMTAEIAARTQPNTLDLIIALFSGAVGSIAVCKNVRGVATSIPGVAIAVALMPPLCVVGYGLGLIVRLDRIQGETVVRGGGLLFLTNLVAITFTAMLVFLLFHIDSAEVRERVRALRTDRREDDFQGFIERIPLPKALASIGSLPGRLLLITSIILLLGVPLTRSFQSLGKEIAARQFENRVQRLVTDVWNESFARSDRGGVRSYIDTFSVADNGGRLAINLRIFTSRPYAPDERSEFVRRIATPLHRSPASIDFSLVEIQTSKYEVEKRSIPEPPARPAPPPPSTESLIDGVRARVAAGVSTVPLPPPATVESHSLTLIPDGERLEVVYVAARDIDVDGQSVLAGDLQRSIGDPSMKIVFRRVPDSATITFGRQDRTVPPQQMAPLDAIAVLATRHPSWSLTVRANARDPREEARSSAIRSALTGAGVDAARITVEEAKQPLRAGSYLVSISSH